MDNPLRRFFSKFHFPRWFRILFRIILGMVILVVISYVGLAWYINSNKEELQAKLLTELNGGISGSLTVESMDPTFLQGFPNVSLRLENVVLRDSLYEKHKRTFLKAGELDVAVNVTSLLRGAIDIRKMNIRDAAIDMFTDASGYSNSAIFKKKKYKETEEDDDAGSFPELRNILLENVTLGIEDVKNGKKYKFTVNELDGDIDYTLSGWEAVVDLDALAHSMAFNTVHGSFIKEKTLVGKFDLSYDEGEGFIVAQPNTLAIGGDDFVIGAKIRVGGKTADFTFNITNKSILWSHASHLLSPNISSKLDMFNLDKEIDVRCDLIGDFNAEGDPSIYVKAEIRDNVLRTPGGIVSKCNFTGVFTNHHVKGKGLNDANSAIKLYNFTGTYAGLPVNMKKTFILNLEKPIAVGDFSSSFEMPQLRNVIDDDLLAFASGTADVNLDFKADIVNFMITRPYIKGKVNVKNADVTYVPRKMDFHDVSVLLDFTSDDLTISTISLKTGKSVINMNGHIKNFMNLYYTDPQKIVLHWNVNSPNLNVGEFMYFLGSRGKAKAAIRKSKKGNYTKEMNEFFEKTNVDIHLNVDKLYYKKFLATNVKANVFLTDSGMLLKDTGLKHAGGTLHMNGSMTQKGRYNDYKLQAKVNNVDVRKFFHAFNNFGMETLKAEHLKGQFSCNANISGNVSNSGALMPKSMYGNVSFGLKKGKLLNFDPVRKVGKFAFPFRDMNNIAFDNLNGNFDVAGEKITIHPMQINSSVLNMDVQGVYSFGKGTELYIDVPLRNPEKDKDITDKKELAERRNRGIVVHLTAEDDKDGKVGIKLGGKKDK
ncbi:AsmA family protein [Flavobacterium hauense]